MHCHAFMTLAQLVVAYLAAAREHGRPAERARQPLFFAKSFMNDASVSTHPSSTAL